MVIPLPPCSGGRRPTIGRAIPRRILPSRGWTFNQENDVPNSWSSLSAQYLSAENIDAVPEQSDSKQPLLPLLAPLSTPSSRTCTPLPLSTQSRYIL